MNIGIHGGFVVGDWVEMEDGTRVRYISRSKSKEVACTDSHGKITHNCERFCVAATDYMKLFQKCPVFGFFMSAWDAFILDGVYPLRVHHSYSDIIEHMKLINLNKLVIPFHFGCIKKSKDETVSLKRLQDCCHFCFKGFEGMDVIVIPGYEPSYVHNGVHSSLYKKAFAICSKVARGYGLKVAFGDSGEGNIERFKSLEISPEEYDISTISVFAKNLKREMVEEITRQNKPLIFGEAGIGKQEYFDGLDNLQKHIDYLQPDIVMWCSIKYGGLCNGWGEHRIARIENDKLNRFIEFVNKNND